jgi:type II secretory pathway pseudopilin PulG
MTVRKSRRAITLVEVLVVIFVIGLLVGLLVPVILNAHETANCNECQRRIKLVGLALLNHENAFGRFPLISSRGYPPFPAAITAQPASAKPGPAEAGWSWIVRILPYFCETNLYKAIHSESDEFNLDSGPFTPSIVTPVKGSRSHCSSVVLSYLICPAWSGNANTYGTSSIDVTGNTSGAPEYASVAGRVAPTNYKAIVGTHMVDGAPLENGGMLLTAKQGSTVSSIIDGLSKTLMVAETKECGYASWYDGTLNWLVTNDPNAKTSPGTGSGKDALPPWINAQLAINVGPKAGDPTPVYYLPSSLTKSAPKNPVNWGPSSDHANGAVMHVFADDHVQAITVLCDPQAYLAITTRAGSEALEPVLIDRGGH